MQCAETCRNIRMEPHQC